MDIIDNQFGKAMTSVMATVILFGTACIYIEGCEKRADRIMDTTVSIKCMLKKNFG